MIEKLKKYEAIVASGEIGEGTRHEVAVLLGRAANEIAEKDAEIRELTKELLKKYAKDGVPLEAHNADMAASNREIMSLRALVKEMADALDSYPCHNCKHGSERCEWCGTVKELDALVERAREVVK